MAVAEHYGFEHKSVLSTTLLTFSLLTSEESWLSLDFPGDRSILSTSVGGYKNPAIAGRREENLCV